MIQLQYLRNWISEHTIYDVVIFGGFWLFLIANVNWSITSMIYGFSHPTLTHTQVFLHSLKSFIWQFN